MGSRVRFRTPECQLLSADSGDCELRWVRGLPQAPGCEGRPSGVLDVAFPEGTQGGPHTGSGTVRHSLAAWLRPFTGSGRLQATETRSKGEDPYGPLTRVSMSHHSREALAQSDDVGRVDEKDWTMGCLVRVGRVYRRSQNLHLGGCLTAFWASLSSSSRRRRSAQSWTSARPSSPTASA